MKLLPAAVFSLFAVAGTAVAQELPVPALADPVLAEQVTVRPSPRPVNRTAQAPRVRQQQVQRVVKPRSRVTLVAEREVEQRPARRVLKQPGPTFLGAFF